MNDQEKVIKGLECCGKGNRIECANCDYLCEDNCYKTLCDDAIALLKAQEPRVMNADEVAKLTTNICEWLWIEEAQRVTWNLHCMRAFVYSKHPDTGGFYIMADAHHDVVKLEGDEYGKTWRIWTSLPTNTQREAEPWPQA